MCHFIGMINRNLAIALVIVLIIMIIAGGVFVWQKQNNPPLCTLEARAGLTIQLQDEDGSPINDAIITSGQQIFVMFADGTYSGLHEGKGTYEFRIEKDGYVSYIGSVDLKHDQCHVLSQNQTIILQESNEE